MVETKTTPKSGSKASKPVFTTGSPYSSAKWPSVGHALQVNITDTLCELLSPIGQWRAQIPRSKGMRSKKRKRLAGDQDEQPRPPAPELQQYLTIGFNSTTRGLEAQINAPKASASNEPEKSPSNFPITTVFLTDSPTSIQYAHLPILAAMATPPVNLIPLHSGAEAKLSIALGLPRVGVIGLQQDAPDAVALLAYCEDIPPVEVPYLKQVKDGVWLGVNVEKHVPGGLSEVVS